MRYVVMTRLLLGEHALNGEATILRVRIARCDR